MPSYPIESSTAFDPDNPSNVVRSGVVGIYDPSDLAGINLIPLKDLDGMPIANPLISGPLGHLPPFDAGIPQVRWKSGEFGNVLNSYTGLRDEALAARAAAELAQLAAENAAGLVTAPTDDAIAAAVAADGPTRAALDLRYINQDALAAKVGRGENEIYIEDLLASNRVEGVTDDRPAFQTAIATGLRIRSRGSRLHLSKSPDWGDNSWFVGAGKGKTIIKLLDSAPADATLWCNKDLTGNVQGYFADFTLDGNAGRQGGALVAAGGSRSSTLTFRNTRHFYVDRVSSINSLQHGFDVTRGHLDYAYVGDGNFATLRSSDCQFDQVDASGFGDDGFTTHSSDYVKVSRSVFFNPRLRGNCNGIEIDGDSRYCTLEGNRTYNCYAGVEIKGHGSESAAQHTTINGHTDTGSVRSYNFRHIGQQSGSDPVSLSAFGIIAHNLVSIDPNNDAGFQDDATPRALSISAYQDVVINGFIAKGRGGYGAGAVAVQVQFRASAQINGLAISGWSGADVDVSITTDGKVGIAGLSLRASAANGIYTGASVTAVQIAGVNATAPATGAGTGIDIYKSAGVDVSGITGITGYATPVRADFTDYVSVGHFLRRFHPVPAGATSMKTLDPTKNFYMSSAQYAAMGTDRPTGTSGGHFLTRSEMSGDACVETLRKNTGSSLQYWRVLYWTNQTATSWMQVTATAVAYSAT